MEVSGRIQDAPSYGGTPIFKRGDATLMLSGVNTFSGRLTVVAGKVALASDTALPASAPITLNGGALTCGAGTSNSSGALTLSGSAALALGDGATLSFADSSGAAWADGAKLAVTGPDSPSPRALRFGTSSGGLTSAQLRKVTYNGRRAVLDDDGYIAPRIGLGVILR